MEVLTESLEELEEKCTRASIPMDEYKLRLILLTTKNSPDVHR